jgi:hypothetical protein
MITCLAPLAEGLEECKNDNQLANDEIPIVVIDPNNIWKAECGDPCRY